jgi:hypothetical protein
MSFPIKPHPVILIKGYMSAFLAIRTQFYNRWKQRNSEFSKLSGDLGLCGRILCPSAFRCWANAVAHNNMVMIDEINRLLIYPPGLFIRPAAGRAKLRLSHGCDERQAAMAVSCGAIEIS